MIYIYAKSHESSSSSVLTFAIFSKDGLLIQDQVTNDVFNIANFTPTALVSYVPIYMGGRSGTPGAAASWEGYQYYDTTAKKMYFSNGTVWKEIATV